MNHLSKGTGHQAWQIPEQRVNMTEPGQSGHFFSVFYSCYSRFVPALLQLIRALVPYIKNYVILVNRLKKKNANVPVLYTWYPLVRTKLANRPYNFSSQQGYTWAAGTRCAPKIGHYNIVCLYNAQIYSKRVCFTRSFYPPLLIGHAPVGLK